VQRARPLIWESADRFAPAAGVRRRANAWVWRSNAKLPAKCPIQGLMEMVKQEPLAASSHQTPKLRCISLRDRDCSETPAKDVTRLSGAGKREVINGSGECQILFFSFSKIVHVRSGGNTASAAVKII